jgi:hypothetical protein
MPTYEQRAMARFDEEISARARVLARRFFDIHEKDNGLFDATHARCSRLIETFERLLREGDIT